MNQETKQNGNRESSFFILFYAYVLRILDHYLKLYGLALGRLIPNGRNKNVTRCSICKLGKTCYLVRQVAIRKLLSWAWVTCLFFMPEMLLKSTSSAFKVNNAFGEFLLRELKALSGAVTITCLMMANLGGYVIGPSGLNWFISSFLRREGVFFSFYLGTKLMFHIQDLRSGVHSPRSEELCFFFSKMQIDILQRVSDGLRNNHVPPLTYETTLTILCILYTPNQLKLCGGVWRSQAMSFLICHVLKFHIHQRRFCTPSMYQVLPKCVHCVYIRYYSFTGYYV
ncbi:hypothetical protein Bca4012_013183 [Brassica carinata]